MCLRKNGISLLELLHPDGSVSTSFVLGGNCPENLFPQISAHAGQKIELFILAPTVGECRTAGWLESAARSINEQLADDGVCYVLVPPSWRLKTIRFLAGASLVMDAAFWHFPHWTASHYLVPLQQYPAQFAVDNILPARPWKKNLARTTFSHQAMQQLLGVFWKPIGLSFRRPDARPRFQWLFQGDQGTAIIRRSWRGHHGAEILYPFTPSETQPSAIVKTASTKNSSACIDREAKVLELLEAGVRTADARLPDVLRKQKIDQRSSLFLSPIHGQSVSDLLASNPGMLSPILTKIVRWLERWHITTKQIQMIDEQQLEHAVLAPMERLSPFLHDGERYQNWLLQHIQALRGSPLPTVATHNDLTMANVLIDEQIGIVDWETGMAESWPLVDFYYAVADAVRIAQGSISWLDAFKACYEPHGHFSQDVHAWEQQLRSAIGMSARYSELCFHVCWLHHASNEHAVNHPGEPRPFLQIVQWLAANCAVSIGNQN